MPSKQVRAGNCDQPSVAWEQLLGRSDAKLRELFINHQCLSQGQALCDQMRSGAWRCDLFCGSTGGAGVQTLGGCRGAQLVAEGRAYHLMSVQVLSWSHGQTTFPH